MTLPTFHYLAPSKRTPMTAISIVRNKRKTNSELIQVNYSRSSKPKLTAIWVVLVPLILAICLSSCSEEENMVVSNDAVDADGNVYQTVVIGSQEWMTENLRSSHFANGEPIPHVPSIQDWVVLNTAAFCWYNNDSLSEVPHGKLYNWFAVNDSRNVCPTGWHVPSTQDWDLLSDHLGGADVAGGPLKATGTIQEGTGLWLSPNDEATNQTAFTGIPSGARGFWSGIEPPDESYAGMGGFAIYWANSSANMDSASYRYLSYGNGRVYAEQALKSWGMTIRCVRD
jgi:uncharacterized protein (TIGR02145 family)